MRYLFNLLILSSNTCKQLWKKRQLISSVISTVDKAISSWMTKLCFASDATILVCIVKAIR